MSSLNGRIELGLRALLLLPHITAVKGDSADRTIVAKLASVANIRKLVSAEQWKEDKEFAEARAALAAREFRFKKRYELPFVVDKPNGSQQWPDAAIVFQQAALPLEVKSGQGETIAWNSGGGDRIHPSGIYIFNGKSPRKSGRSDTTFFLGEDMISEAEKRILEVADGANQAVAKQFNRLLEDSNSQWNLYARPMFNCRERVLTTPERLAREEKVLQLVRDYRWEV